MKSTVKLSSVVACFVVSLAASALAGCSSDNSSAPPSYSCTSKGPCANDPVPSSDQASSCQKLQDDSVCGAAFTAYSQCAYAVAICGDGGMSDPTADSVSKACAAEYATYATCLGNKIVDGGS